MVETRRPIHIYRIYFPSNGKCYIGQTYNMQRRMLDHVKGRFNSAVHKALMKHDGWKIYVMHKCYTKDEANRIEIEEIRNFDSVVPNGYNLTRGGEGGAHFLGHRHTEATKRKLKDKATGHKHTDEVRRKIGATHKGKHVSEATRKKIRAARLGTKLTEETRQKISDKLKGRKPPGNMRGGMKGHKVYEETKHKISHTMKGHKVSDVTRLKISLSLKKRAYFEYQQKIKELEQEIEQQ